MSTPTPASEIDPPVPAGPGAESPLPGQQTVARLALEEVRQEIAAERQRLAQALHATVAQSLTATYFFAKQIEMQFAKDNPELSEKIARLGNLVRQASSELQACTRGLEPDDLPPSGREESSPGSDVHQLLEDCGSFRSARAST